MKTRIVSTPKSDTRIEFVQKEHAGNIPDFDGEPNSVGVTYDSGKTVVSVGVGEAKTVTAAVIRTAAATAARRVASLKRTSACIIEPQFDCFDERAARSAVEGFVLGSYVFDKYKSDKPVAVATLEYAGKRLSSAAAARIMTVADAVCHARDLVNENASVAFPEYLAEQARAFTAQGATVKVIDEKEMKRIGMGLLLAVGQGAPHPPRLITIAYRGNPKSTDTTAIVGKGITFDSGGLNLKPTGHIETMRMDMAGAAAVLGTMKAVFALKPKINVTGVIAAAYNAIDATAYIPGDIYRAYDGKTVEIHSTDAEGRLVLADAMAYVTRHHKPTAIIDLATLTGGVLYALGDTIAALIATSDTLAQRLFDAGERCGEPVWRLPLRDEHRDSLKGDLGDLRNISKLKKGYASTITGGAFIGAFIGDTPWAHLDIAGTAYNEGEARGEVCKNGTGFGVRLLLDFLGVTE